MDRLVRAIAVVVAATAAGTQIAGLYAGRIAVAAIAWAAVGAVLISLLPLRRSLRMLAVGAGLAAAVVVLHRTLSPADDLADAVAHAGARLLTSATPVPPRLDTLALPVIGTWLAAATASAFSRGRRPATAAVPLVALAVAMLVLAGPQSRPAYPATGALVVALTVLLAVSRSPHSGTPKAARRTVRLGAAALIAAALGAASALLAPPLLAGMTATPPDLRSVVIAPIQAPDQVHPLSLLGRWSAHPEQPLLTVTADRPMLLRWAILGDFDGTAWHPAAVYRAAGGDRGATSGTQPTEQVTAGIQVAGLTGAWLPVPDGLRRVDGVAIAVDEQSGTIVVPDGLRAGMAYTVEARVPVPDPVRLAGAELPQSTAYDPYRQLPAGNTGRIPELAQAAAGDGLPYAQAVSLARWLTAEYRFDPRAPGGSGYPSINRFLTAPVASGGGRGTSEQFAAAYAVLARALGIPARVVVGFDVGTAGAGISVTAADARAWPEIYLEPVGWLPIDVRAPAATAAPLPSASPRPSLTAQPTQSPQPEPSDTPDPGVPAVAVPDPLPAPGPGFPWQRLAWLALLPIPILAAVVLLRLRRSRRRLAAQDDASRIRGAWAELRDGARLAGVAIEPHWTATEVVAKVSAAARVPAEDHLANAVNVTQFAGIADESVELDAARAVGQATDLIHRVRRGASRLRRARWWLDPRPLWWSR